jgi:dipeptidyl aminopeptidase/acylaminoacyl peptidase
MTKSAMNKSTATVTNTFLLIVILALLGGSVARAQNLTVREIMAEPSIAGQRVEGEKLSPDGSKVVFLWNAEGKLPRNLYLVSTSGGTSQIILRQSDLPRPSATPQPENKLNYGLELRDDFVKARENQLGGFEWSPDSKKLVFSYGGDVYVHTIGEKGAKRFTQTQSPESGARFLDNGRIMFSQGGNVFVMNTSDSMLTQLTKEANQQTNVAVGNSTPNKAGTMLAYVVSDSSKFRSLVVPNYLPEFVAANPTRRGWSEQKLFVTPTDGSRDTPFEIKLPKPEGVSNFRRMVWTADGRSLIVDRNDKDTKRRQLFYIHNVGSKDEQIILVTEETDDKWQAPLSTIFEPNPKNPAQLFFGSERDGYNHLYLAKLEAETRAVASVPDLSAKVAEGGIRFSPNIKIEQLTKGNWQVEWAKWVGNGKDLVYSSTEENSATREFYHTEGDMEDEDGDSPNEWKVEDKHLPVGMKTSPQMETSGDKVHLIYSYSRWNSPDELIYQQLCYRCSGGQVFPKAIRLTRTIPTSFEKRNWTEPKFIDIPSRDGKQIKSKIYLPASHDPKKKYPMAIFVHGAGYLQNTINGWNNYWREFMFNDLLAKKGYVVLDIDYRGSAGYGREWRTDVYDFLGGKDFDDHIDAIDFMVKNYGVNQSKIGVYGGSYGGFMAGMLAMRAPERIAAAAALRPVFDWKNYYAANPQYTAQRLGFPDKNPEAYKRSSPISYADKLERPLLILHGMSDDNVHVQDSVQMIEKLIRLGKTKYFEAMLYPSENHGFVRPESWTDEYERIFTFFEKHLK